MRGTLAPVLAAVTALLAASAAGAGTGWTRIGLAQVIPRTPASSLNHDLVRSDSLYRAMDAEGAMGLIRARLAVAPEDFEATWRAAAVALTLGVLAQDQGARLGWLRSAATHGDRLLILRPDDPVSLTWASATKGRLAIEERNPLRTAGLGKEVWVLTEALLASDPGSAMGHAIRGKLMQEIRRLSRAERLLARILLGNDIAGVATWSDAERHLEWAVAADPGMVLFRLDLGDTYRLQGKAAQARDAYARGLALPDRLPVDPYYKRRILDGMKALGAPTPDGAVNGGSPAGQQAR